MDGDGAAAHLEAFGQTRRSRGNFVDEGRISEAFFLAERIHARRKQGFDLRQGRSGAIGFGTGGTIIAIIAGGSCRSSACLGRRGTKTGERRRTLTATAEKQRFHS
jgi:hypothetical protein